MSKVTIYSSFFAPNVILHPQRSSQSGPGGRRPPGEGEHRVALWKLVTAGGSSGMRPSCLSH